MDMKTTTNTGAATRATKKITVWEIRSRDYTQFGVRHAGRVVEHHHAEIVPGKSIRLFGLVKAGQRYVKDPISGRMLPCEEHVYLKDFSVGDVAEYDSFNMSYTGRIVSITEKGVTIEEQVGCRGVRRHRLDLETFDRRNWDFDAEETARRNSEWRD